MGGWLRSELPAGLRRNARLGTVGIRNLSGEQLTQHVLQSEAEGLAAGLQSERAQGQWAYLALTTGGAFGRNGKLLGYVMHGGGVPDTN